MLQTKKKKLTTERPMDVKKEKKKKTPWLPSPQITIPNHEAPQAFWAVPERWMEEWRSSNIWSFWKSWAALLTSGRELVASTYTAAAGDERPRSVTAQQPKRRLMQTSCCTTGAFWNFTISKIRASVCIRALTDKDDWTYWTSARDSASADATSRQDRESRR